MHPDAVRRLLPFVLVALRRRHPVLALAVCDPGLELVLWLEEEVFSRCRSRSKIGETGLEVWGRLGLRAGTQLSGGAWRLGSSLGDGTAWTASLLDWRWSGLAASEEL
ncbi:hypothetical protein GCM10010428_75160 [Actinosynnema pretiosum subsp. pretiosum]